MSALDKKKRLLSMSSSLTLSAAGSSLRLHRRNEFLELQGVVRRSGHLATCPARQARLRNTRPTRDLDLREAPGFEHAEQRSDPFHLPSVFVIEYVCPCPIELFASA